jgi:hypothetical protein
MQCGQELSDYSKNISFTETRVILQPNVQSFESQFDKKEVLSVFFRKIDELILGRTRIVCASPYICSQNLKLIE